MISTLEATVKSLADRQAILDCLFRYTRGIDRLDRALALSAYHRDAIDDHGPFVGPADWALAFHGEHQITHHHIITNHTVEIDDDTAHAETYYAFIGENLDGKGTLAIGRYLDRLQNREGRWAIVFRRCINEAAFKLEAASQSAEWLARMRSSGASQRDFEDPSYLRPLTATRFSAGA